MAKPNFCTPSTRRARLGRAVSTVAAAVMLTVAGLGAAPASGDPYYWDPCDDPINMPCTTH